MCSSPGCITSKEETFIMEKILQRQNKYFAKLFQNGSGSKTEMHKNMDDWFDFTAYQPLVGYLKPKYIFSNSFFGV